MTFCYIVIICGLCDHLLVFVKSLSFSPASLSLVFLILDGTSLSDPSVVCDRRLFFSDSLPGVFWVPATSGSKSPAVERFLFCSDGSASIACSLVSSAEVCTVAPSFFFFFFRFFFSSSSPTVHECQAVRGINTTNCTNSLFLDNKQVSESGILCFYVAKRSRDVKEMLMNCTWWWIVCWQSNGLPTFRLGENPWLPGSIFRGVVQHLFQRSKSFSPDWQNYGLFQATVKY